MGGWADGRASGARLRLVVYKRDNDNDDDSQSTASTPTTSAASKPAATAAAATEADCFEVCLVAPREGFALVPRGNVRFCRSCANRLATLDSCPMCRANITMVIYRRRRQPNTDTYSGSLTDTCSLHCVYIL